MENYDKAMAERVWKRVRGGQAEPGASPSPAGELLGLIQAEWAAAAAYLALSRQMGPKEAAVLQRIFREEQTHAACLKGMYTLITGQKPVVQTPQPERAPVEAALRRSYAGELRSIAAYDARSADPEYGHVFASMAKQEREHSRAVLELLGGLEKK